MLTQVLPNTLPYVKYPTDKDANDPWRKAYRACLQHEARATTQVDFMRSRVLGYSIREAPNNESRDTLCQDINSCNEDNAFCDLANGYIRFLAQLCESTLASQSHWSDYPYTRCILVHSSWGPTPSYDFLGNSLNNDIEETPHSKCREQVNSSFPS